MSYKVTISHTGLVSGKGYKVGDILKEEDFHQALFNTNNQYHMPFIEEVEEVAEEAGYTEEELSQMKKADLQGILDAENAEYDKKATNEELINQILNP